MHVCGIQIKNSIYILPYVYIYICICTYTRMKVCVYVWFCFFPSAVRVSFCITLRKTNMEPASGPSKKAVIYKGHLIQVPCLFSGLNLGLLGKEGESADSHARTFRLLF